MYKVCIDPGHAGGHIDPGAIGVSGTQEADVNLAVSKLVKQYLEAAGCEVYMTRTEQEQAETDELSYRTTYSDSVGADLFVSIHANSAPSCCAEGTETWYWYCSDKGKKLAQCIQNQLVNSLGLSDRGIKESAPGQSLYVLHRTNAVSVLVELGFLSNASDEAVLNSSKGQDTAAAAIARGITDYLNEI